MILRDDFQLKFAVILTFLKFFRGAFFRRACLYIYLIIYLITYLGVSRTLEPQGIEGRYKNKMSVYKNKMSVYKNKMSVYKNKMSVYKNI